MSLFVHHYHIIIIQNIASYVWPLTMCARVCTALMENALLTNWLFSLW